MCGLPAAFCAYRHKIGDIALPKPHAHMVASHIFVLRYSLPPFLLDNAYKYSVSIRIISGEQHCFLGLNSLQRPTVQAFVTFLISSKVLAPLFIALTISSSVTFEQ